MLTLNESRGGMAASGAEDPKSMSLPAAWDEQLRRRLDPGETVLAWFESDLDDRLRYTPQLVVLTSSRLLAVDPGGPATGNGKAGQLQAWSLGEEVRLKTSEQGVVGTLEVLGA